MEKVVIKEIMEGGKKNSCSKQSRDFKVPMKVTKTIERKHIPRHILVKFLNSKQKEKFTALSQ